MFSTWTIDRFQRVGVALSHQKALRSFSWRTVGSGLFLLFIGIPRPEQENSIPAIGVVGLWMALYGIAMLCLPAAQAMPLGKGSGIIAFIIILAMIIYDMMSGAPPHDYIPRSLTGFIFIVIGFVVVHSNYKRRIMASPPPLHADDEVQFREAITALMQADHQTASHIVQFAMGKAMLRGELVNTMIVLTAERGNVVRALAREDFELVPELNGTARKGIAIHVRMQQQWGAGAIDELSYRRYQEWKARGEA